MLEVRGLSKAFGALNVVNNISLSLQKGERRVLLGPNGAGKTTLFNLLTGEIRPDRGRISLNQTDITNMSVEGRARNGLARSYQKNHLFDDLRVAENLALGVALSQGVRWRDFLRSPRIQKRVEEIREMTGLADCPDLPVGHLSYGVRRQLEIALALASAPRLLLLDEPTSGLGPGMVEGFQHLLQSLPRAVTILIIEHNMDLAFAIADRVSVLNHGEMLFEGTPDAARNNALVREIYLG